MRRKITSTAQSTLILLVLAFPAAAWGQSPTDPHLSAPWNTCQSRAKIHADCSQNIDGLVRGWIELKRDPQTHLYSRDATWNYENEAADHYSSLVLMAFYVAPEHNEPGGTFHETMVNSRRLCDTPSGIPTVYRLKTRERGRLATLADLSEWLRDGLLRIVEVKGTGNIWYEEMVRLADAMLAEAEKRGGMFAAFEGHEPWGNMLQTLARLYAISGDEKYLLAAEQIADPLLLDPKHAVTSIRYQDHGCELTAGLTELFVVESKLHRPKAEAYRGPLECLLDRILTDAAHPETGLFCSKAKDGQWLQPTDTWGYVLFGHENYDRATGSDRYRTAIEKPLRWLLKHRPDYSRYSQTLWPRAISADDWSDSHESMIVLWNRYPSTGDGFAWLDWATLQHVHRRETSGEFGPYTGGHFDGSTGRTLCSHMMMCSQGVRHQPYQLGVGLGAEQRDGELFLTVDSASPYRGTLCFDWSRTEYRKMNIDWARINEMPQWYVVRPEKEYSVTIADKPCRTVPGRQLIDGLPIEVVTGETLKVQVCLSRRRAHDGGGQTRFGPSDRSPDAARSCDVPDGS